MEAIIALLDGGADVHRICPRAILGTPLSQALFSWGAEIDNLDRKLKVDVRDRLFKLLVERGVDVELSGTGTLPNALSAACLGGTTYTIRFLIDAGCSVHQMHQATGRLPLHLAAASGLPNFAAITSSYREDLMAPDHAGEKLLTLGSSIRQR